MNRRKKCFLIGGKLGHSYSAEIHRFWADYDYELKPLAPDEVGPFLQNGDFDGLNVTIPYKETVLPYCDRLTPEARTIGCVNTIIRTPEGKLQGYNTDYAGFCSLATRAGIDFNGRKVLIFGSGGTAKTAKAAAGNLGAEEIVIISRRGPVCYGNLPQHRDGEILVNTTPVGMFPETAAMPCDPGDFPCCCGVLDVIYNPARTRLLQRAAELGIPASNGLWMLAEQARAAGELFSGRELPAELTAEVCRQLELNTLNCVLIGMPGSGKSTVGKIVAEMLNRPVLDIDELITGKTGLTPADIFAKSGEKVFRELEKKEIAAAGLKTGAVIVSGGGAVLDWENVRNLAQNGRIIRLKRRLEDLTVGNGRPLSNTKEAVNTLAEKREPLYAAAADAEVRNDGTPEETARAVIKAFRDLNR